MSDEQAITFPSGGAMCAGRHLPGVGDALATGAGRPVVVMAHGLGGTMDSGLEPFATGLAAAGFDVLRFDYRGFGESGGEPRQTVSVARQVEDYRAAMTAAAALPGTDPVRLVLWGVSLAGGHVLTAAAGRSDVAAVVSLTPLVSGVAAARHAVAALPAADLLRGAVAGLRRGRIPIVGKPGDVAALSLEGMYDDYLSIAGPTWVNEIDASVGLELGRVRAARDAARVGAPVLVQVADFDRSAPPHAAMKAAFKARAQVRHYPCDHFDVWPGKPWFDAALTHQSRFLTRALGGE